MPVAGKPEKDISRIFREGTLIDEAIAKAGREAVLQHKQKGLPLVIWRDGQIVLVPPEELAAEEDKTGRGCQPG
jgi:hypothetical protein